MPKIFAILAVEGKGVVISVGPKFWGGFFSSKNNRDGSTSIALANLSKVDWEGTV